LPNVISGQAEASALSAEDRIIVRRALFAKQPAIFV
jgi:hypothetical protein